jgi:YVTN family beta-propeller protein
MTSELLDERKGCAMSTFMAVLLLMASVTAGEANPEGIDKALQSAPDDFLVKAVVGPRGDGTYVVPTTQLVNPAGQSIEFPGRPVDLALSPDGTRLAVKNREDILFVDPATHAVAQTLSFPRKTGATFVGLAWSRDGKRLYTTETQSNLRMAVLGDDGRFTWTDVIPLPGLPNEKEPNAAAGGLVLDEDANIAYVALSRTNALGVVNLASKEVIAQIPVGIAPYTVVVNGTTAYVSNWGGRVPREGDTTGPTSGSRAVVDPKTGIASTGTVSVVDLKERKVVAEVETGLHPSGMAFSPDRARLYVANANSDTVSVIDTASNALVDTLGVKPMADLPFGSAPNALAVSPDGAALYVALGGNNCIAVADLAAKRVKGLVPTGWYPGAIALLKDGSLAIANTKGVGSRYQKANAAQKAEMFGEGVVGYNSHDYLGSLTFVQAFKDDELAQCTERVATNMRLPMMHTALNMPKVEQKTVPVPTRPGEVSPFKHVLYIIKENRTYDQILGDMSQGNGDPRLCQFGREVTPNHHALAEEFVLFDNFYCNGVLSADGHQWTDEGFVTDYLEKSFGDFVRSYPYDGDDAVAYASSGFIWDHVLAKGLTFRNYGEFVRAKIEPASATWAEIYADFQSGAKTIQISPIPQLDTLKPYLCPTFVGFPGKVQDVYRVSEFIKELKDFEAKGELPNFMIMLLPNDHTSGTREGLPTPRAMVADNDLALGQIVTAVSHSKFWPETLIFVVEDDPQAGLDHVDGHRTVALCISPYTKRGYVDHTHYTQTSMLRTMELVFGLAPMTQLTLAANPMLDCFQETADPKPYDVKPNNIPLDEMNPKVASLHGLQKYYAQKSMEMPLDDIDQADENLFNRVIWHSVKGYDTPYPKLAKRNQADGKAWGMKGKVEIDD